MNSIFRKMALLFLTMASYIISLTISNPAIATTKKNSTTELRLSSVEIALDSFLLDVGRYPETYEGLSALVEKPNNVSSQVWSGPYLRYSHSLKDLWGRDYKYIYPGIHNKNSFDLFSLGRDGIEGTIDDINNWDKNMPWREYYKTWKDIFWEYLQIIISLVGGLIGGLFAIVQEIRQRKRSKNELA